MTAFKTQRDEIKEEYLSGARMRQPSHTLCYSAVNLAVLCRVPVSAKRLLDLGCGTGALGRELKEITDREVFGVTYSKEEAALAAKNLDRVIVCGDGGDGLRPSGDSDAKLRRSRARRIVAGAGNGR